MAKQAKKAAPKKSAAKKPPTDVEAALIDAAFRLAATHGWRHVSLAEIAAEAGVPLSRTLPLFTGKTGLLRSFIRRIDRDMLATADTAEGDSPRDRLFDVMMARFDALEPYRDGLAAVLKDSACDPVAGLCLMPATVNSLALMLEAAGIPTGGVGGALRLKGLGLVYADAMRTFLRDESDDLAKTMARLDTGLKRAERAAGALRWGDDRAPRAEPET